MLKDILVYDSKHLDVEEQGITTVYFKGPSSLFGLSIPEADGIELSVDFPTDNLDETNMFVEFSPIVNGEYPNWLEISLSVDTRKELKNIIRGVL